ncbi:MAG: hypothetical protein A4E31_00203 [Methanomassiliicoccales archaeon PtaU1.Bin030]|nr:MAG: hypothetical protein A4E31_00203 [Methanomassiliicoccales archaeon PtaU1.Bin030]
MFPIPMSKVSPKMRKRPLVNDITWVLPPDAYRSTGSVHSVLATPTSRWAMQWLTPRIGRSRDMAKARAAVATVRRHGPNPGPWEKQTTSTSRSWMPALATALFIRVTTTSEWWFAASRGWMPPLSGRYMSSSFARMLAFSSTIPTPQVWAVPSIPRQIMVVRWSRPSFRSRTTG